jgi:hypothetical protein
MPFAAVVIFPFFFSFASLLRNEKAGISNRPASGSHHHEQQQGAMICAVIIIE